MSFRGLVRDYLARLQHEWKSAIEAGQHTDEMSYRPALDNFFHELTGYMGEDIVKVFEPRNQGRAGRPDWRFHNRGHLGIYGYVEAKGLNTSSTMSVQEHEEQISAYLSLGHRLIVTDGMDFYFYFPDREIQRFAILEKPLSNRWSEQEPDLRLEQIFREFFESASARTCTEEELVMEVARRTRNLSNSVQDLVGLPIEAARNEGEVSTISALNQLKTLVGEHHDPRLRDVNTFADFIAQVLMFGLLYAHRVTVAESDTPEIRRTKILEFWFNTISEHENVELMPFRALIDILTDELDELGPLGTWYQDCVMFLAFIRLEERQVFRPDYHSLYERFLTVFDPSTRFDFGAFYTPWQLASFAVKLVKAIVASEWEGASIYDNGNKLIDPCCGTGTFLEHLLENVDLSENQTPSIVGFEILPAPYALAHYRLTMLQNSFSRYVRIMLTNTLSDELEHATNGSDSSNLIAREQQQARIYASKPITLIIGNPPSSDSSEMAGSNFTIVERLLEDFRPPMGNRRARQNIQKQLRNSFVLFLRWACHKLIDDNRAVLALVLPSSFAEHPTYQYARNFLKENFGKIWVLDIDHDARTGIRAHSLFNTLQGRLLLVAIREEQHHACEDNSVFYGSIADYTKEEKLEFLASASSRNELLSPFESLQAQDEHSGFRPAHEFDRETYEQFWPIYNVDTEHGRYIFARHCSGMKLAPTSLFVHNHPDVFRRRIRDILSTNRNLQDVANDWFLGQDKVPSIDMLDFMRGNLSILWNRELRDLPLAGYSFRPFLRMNVLLFEPLLRAFERLGGGTRRRPEIIRAFQDSRTMGIALSLAPKDLGERLHRFASFCWNFPDNDLSRRGNARIFCNYYPPYGGGNVEELESNIHPELVRTISQMLSLGTQETVSQITYYVYGVLCSDLFLDEFEGALFTLNNPNQQARIPFSAEAELFGAISEKGQRLAQLEDFDEIFTLDSELAHLENQFNGRMCLQSYKIDGESERIELRGATSAGETTKVELGPIRREVLEFVVSGYQVLEQWLKFNSHPYTGTEFTESNYLELLDVINRIKQQLDIVRELDSDIQRLLSDTSRLI